MKEQQYTPKLILPVITMLFIAAAFCARTGRAQCSFGITAEVEPPTACGAANGYIDITPTSGTPPFVYTWSNSATTSLITGLTPGLYTVIITDGASCVHYDTFALTVPPTVAITIVQVVNCFGGTNGSLKASGVCGLRNTTGLYYQYKWYQVSGSTSTLLVGQVDSIAAGLGGGIYYAVIKDANNDTAKSANIVLTQPAQIVPAVVVTAVTCNGGGNGAVTISANGGTPGYTYAMGSGSYGSTGTFSTLTAGNYVFHVKDAPGCIKDTTITLSQPTRIVPAAAVVNVICNGASSGVVTVSATGGTGAYTYAKDAGTYGSGGNFTSLAAGTYTFHVKDAAGCVRDTVITITQPTVIVPAAVVTNIACYNASTGSVSLTATGGVGSYTYAVGSGSYTASGVFNGLSAGGYTFHVKDANSCIHDTTITLTQPTVIVPAAVVTNIACYNASTGSVSLTATGGVGSYTYAVGSGSYTASGVFNGLSAGGYTFHVKDANSCIHDTTITLTQPTVIVPAAVVTNIACYNASTGSVSLTATGGVGSYTYALGLGTYTASGVFNGLSAGGYTFHVKDANSCIHDTTITLTQPTVIVPATVVTNIACYNASTGSVFLTATGGVGSYTYAVGSGSYTASGVFNGLSAGGYTFHVKDANSCIHDTTITLTQPTVIVPATVVTNIACYNASTGSVSLTATGGVGSYTYAVGSGSYTASGVFNGLSAGGYTFHVKDANSCIRDTTITLTQPTVIIPAAAVTNIACYNASTGSVSLTATGGVGSYTYAVGSGSYTASGVFNGLSAGGYTFHVKDANSCIHDTAITLTQPTRIVPVALVINDSCFSNSNGVVTINATGGTGSYTYAVGSGSYGASNSFTGLPAGSFTFHVKDLPGCVQDTSITITQPAALTLAVSTTPVSCYGGSDGTATAAVNGGTAPYHYLWSNSATLAALSGVNAGTYSLQVTDSLGCTILGSGIVVSPDSITIIATVANPSCHDDCNGSISLQISGGTSPYSYQWTNSAITKDINLLCAGAYSLTITDTKNCTKTAGYTLTNPVALTVDAGVDRKLCKTGTLVLKAAASDTAASYHWTSSVAGFIADTASVTISQPGNYYVVVTRNGCKGYDTVVITQTTDDLSAEFVASTQAFKDSLFSLVNISSPEPDSVRWGLPNTPNVVTVSRSKHLAELIFRDTGVYIVTMTARSGQCEKTVEDKIIVIEGKPYTPVAGNNHRSYIRAFTIAPNPSNGQFMVHIELDENGPVRLRLISLQSGSVANDKQDSGKKIYDIGYSVSLHSGEYILLLETGHGSQSLKLMIQ